jgi:hypothetical protein
MAQRWRLELWHVINLGSPDGRRRRGCPACSAPAPSPLLPCPAVFYMYTTTSIIQISVFSSLPGRCVSSRFDSYHHGTHVIRSLCRHLKATLSRMVSVRRAPSLVNLVAAGRSNVMALTQYVPVALQEATRVVYTSCKHSQECCLRSTPDGVTSEHHQYHILRSLRPA